MHVRQRLGNCQTQTESAELLRDLSSALLERIENMRQSICSDADAGIAEAYMQAVRGGVDCAHFHFPAGSREFYRILEQVPYDLLESCRIDVDVMGPRAVFRDDPDTLVLCLGPAHVDDARDALMGIDNGRVQRELALGNPRDVEQIVDEAGFELHIAADRGHHRPVFGRKAFVPFHQYGGGEHGSQRCAQFVRQYGEQLVLRLACGFGRRLRVGEVSDVHRGTDQADDAPIGIALRLERDVVGA